MLFSCKVKEIRLLAKINIIYKLSHCSTMLCCFHLFLAVYDMIFEVICYSFQWRGTHFFREVASFLGVRVWLATNF